MKKLIAYAMSLAILLAVPGVALAKKDKGEKPFAGKVTAVDPAGNTITVKTKEEEKTFKATGATITVDGADGKLSDITNKMRVKVTVGTTPDTASAIDATTHKKKNAQ